VPATRVRGRVLALAFSLSVITYLDRICIAAAAPYMMADLGLTVLQMSAVFSAFTLAYSIFEIPSGWLADVRGPRLMLTRIVLWWSAFTMLTGAASGFASLLSIRFLFGAGEAGAFPTIARSFSRWFPRGERGTANGVLFLGSRLGGMLSAPLALLLIRSWSWRAAFVIFGATGVGWALVWYRWYRDRPSEHGSVNAPELALIQEGADEPQTRKTPWRALLSSRNLHAICVMYFAFGYGLYFYFTWLPTYLIRELGFSVLAGGLLSALPFALAGLADLAGGRLTDHVAQARGLRTGRCVLGSVSFLTCAILVLFSTMVPQPLAKAMLLAFALASADLALGACWAVCLDVGAADAGVVTGFMNTFGNIGGLIGPMVVGIAVGRWHSWIFPFYITAIVYTMGAMAWLAIDPEIRIAER
jgi:ACS family glucarate transporter-like MFS transporter